MFQDREPSPVLSCVGSCLGPAQIVIGKAYLIPVAVGLAQKQAVGFDIIVACQQLIAYLDLLGIAEVIVDKAVGKGSSAASFALNLAELSVTIIVS